MFQGILQIRREKQRNHITISKWQDFSLRMVQYAPKHVREFC